MPIVEFECEDCRGTFEELLKDPLRIQGVVCEHCGSKKVLKLLSSFTASAGSSNPGKRSSPKSTPFSGGGGSCGPGCGCH